MLSLLLPCILAATISPGYSFYQGSENNYGFDGASFPQWRYRSQQEKPQQSSFMFGGGGGGGYNGANQWQWPNNMMGGGSYPNSGYPGWQQPFFNNPFFNNGYYNNWQDYYNPQPPYTPQPSSTNIYQQCGRRNSQYGSNSYKAGNHPILGIVGGFETGIENWPWQVSLRYFGAHICGGAILSPRIIVTAAHCFTSRAPSDWSVYASKSKRPLGELGEIGPLEVSAIVTHPNYGMQKKMDSDIALVQLKMPLTYSARIKSICLPQQGSYIPPSPNNMECYVTGFGETKGTGGEDSLKEARVPLYPARQCFEMFPKARPLLTDNMICAGYPEGGTDSCQGDSGGPLVCYNAQTQQFTLDGIVSFGIGCATKNSPGIYTRTSTFLQWIHQTTGGI